MSTGGGEWVGTLDFSPLSRNAYTALRYNGLEGLLKLYGTDALQNKMTTLTERIAGQLKVRPT